MSDDMGAPDRPGQLLGAIFSASPDAIVVIDESGRIVLSSPAIAELFGYYPEELVGESLDILIPVDLRADHRRHLGPFFSSPTARQMGAGLDLAGRHRDGSEFAVEVSLAPVEVRGVRFAAAFVRDGRERRRAIDRVNTVNEITQRILVGDAAGEILPLVAQRARRLCRAEAVWIVTPVASGELAITSVDGPGTEGLLGVVLSSETSRSASVMRTGESEVIDDLSSAANVPRELGPLGLGPGVYVPLIAGDRRLGTLVLGRLRGAPAFAPIDVAFAEVFATAIAAAIENGAVRSELEELKTASDRERIAFDLHDSVIQDLFAIGMSLQAARSTVSGPGVVRIDAAVDGLDNVIREIRNTIFRLPSREANARGLRDEVLGIVDKFRDDLGFVPRVVFRGPVDNAVNVILGDHLLKVFTESLSNAARHAHASSIDIVVAVDDGWLSLSCSDDGVGIPNRLVAGNGLENMGTRARNLGGNFVLSAREPTGTVVEWKVPIS